MISASDVGGNTEARLLKQFVSFARALQDVTYLTMDEEFMTLFEQVFKVLRQKCTERWPKTPQFLKMHFSDLNATLNQSRAMRKAQASQPPSNARPTPPQQQQQQNVTVLTTRPEQPKQPSRVVILASPTPVREKEAPKPVLEKSLSGDQTILDLMASDTVSVWLGPRYSFQLADAGTKLINLSDITRPTDVKGTPPFALQWSKRDTKACIKSALGEKVPAVCLFSADAPIAANPVSATTGSNTTEVSQAGNKKRQTQPEVESAETKTQARKRRRREKAEQNKEAAESVDKPLASAASGSKLQPMPEWTGTHGGSWHTSGESQCQSDLSAGSVDGADLQATEGELYNVEALRDMMKDQNGKEWFLVKWEGYPESDNTWEPLENIETYGDHGSRIRYLRAFYAARLRISKKMWKDENFVWRPFTMEDKRLEAQVYEFIDKERASQQKFWRAAQQFRPPRLVSGDTEL